MDRGGPGGMLSEVAVVETEVASVVAGHGPKVALVVEMRWPGAPGTFDGTDGK